MTKETLEMYYGIASNIEAIEAELNTLYKPISSPNGRPSYGRSLMPSSPTERSAMQIIHLKDQLEMEIERLRALAEEIETWLLTVEDTELVSIIRWHYLMRLNWKRTNIKVYGYPDYSYSRKRVDRYFARLEKE